MPGTYTYPGVYVEELPSSVRSIIGVGTSITAFVGRALKGPVNKAILIHNFSDYQRIFGGLWKKSNMSYAVYQYFQNGGVDAIIVRAIGKDAAPAKFNLNYTSGTRTDKDDKNKDISVSKNGTLKIKVADPGLWGENLKITVSPADEDKKAELNDPTLTCFDLEVSQNGALLEQFRNVSLDPENPRFIGKLLVEDVSTCLRINLKKEDIAELDALKTHLSLLEKQLLATITKAETDLDAAEAALAKATGEPAETAAQTKVDEAKNALKNAKEAYENGLWDFKEKCLPLDSALPASDGDELTAFEIIGLPDEKSGMYALKDADLFNLLCIPAYEEADVTRTEAYAAALPFCTERRAVLIIDPPAGEMNRWTSSKMALDKISAYVDRHANGAIFFPRIVATDPLEEYRLREFDPCGVVAGVIARTDAQRGVWKAPAGIEAVLMGVPDLAVRLTNEQNGELNPKGVNCLRILPDAGRVIWGARTLRGADSLADQWKYLPVRRVALFIEETLFRGTQWAVFEPNDERLWSQIRLNIGAFMHSLFFKGAFQGSDPKQAYMVKCDSETTTQTDIDAGIVNIIVGFAPLKPAEFVIIKIQQLAGQESE